MIDDTCNPIPSCLLILSFVPYIALLIRGTKWSASPPHNVNVNTPYNTNNGFPFEYTVIKSKTSNKHQKWFPLNQAFFSFEIILSALSYTF